MRRTPIGRRTPLRRARGPARARGPGEAPESAATGAVGPIHGMPWEDVRAAIWRRAGGRCEACGCPLELATMHGHHRQTRRVGPDCPGNALALCASCHADAHAAPAAARDVGRIVSRHAADPCRVPVWVWAPSGPRRVMLECAGGWELAPPDPMSSDPIDLGDTGHGARPGKSTGPVDNGATSDTDRDRTDTEQSPDAGATAPPDTEPWPDE